jgi:hypothetical protein
MARICNAEQQSMPDPVEAFINRVRSVAPLPRDTNRRVAIRQKIAEAENDSRIEQGNALAIPALLQRARDRVSNEISRHTHNKVPTRTAEFFQDVLEELSLLARLAIMGEHDDDTFRVEVQVGEAGTPPHVVKSKFYSVEAARQWINSEQGNTLIRAVIEKYEK